MRNTQPNFIAIVVAILDVILINASFWFYADEYGEAYLVKLINSSIVFTFCWLLVEWFRDSYQVHNLLKSDRTISELLKSCVSHLTLSVFGLFAFKYDISRLFILKFYITFIILGSTVRFIFMAYLRYLSRKGYTYKKALILGGGPEANVFNAMIASGWTFGLKLVGLLSDEKPLVGSMPYLGTYEDFSRVVKEQEVNEVYWTGRLKKSTKIDEIISLCEKKMIRFHVIPEFLNYPLKNFKVYNFGGLPMMHFRHEPLESTLNRLLKRVFDVVFSVLVIILILSWLTPILAILIKLSSKGPVFFIQKRTGQNNKSFNMIKFRTMTVNFEADEKQAVENDARVTAIGRFLRRTSMDELPQFFNSFIGNMSVVGPRPHMLKHTEDYSQIIDQFMTRHYIKSGITGLAQAKGERGETKNVEDMRQRVNYDVWYLENWSLWLDIKICAWTFWLILFNKDKAY